MEWYTHHLIESFANIVKSPNIRTIQVIMWSLAISILMQSVQAGEGAETTWGDRPKILAVKDAWDPDLSKLVTEFGHMGVDQEEMKKLWNEQWKANWVLPKWETNTLWTLSEHADIKKQIQHILPWWKWMTIPFFYNGEDYFWPLYWNGTTYTDKKGDRVLFHRDSWFSLKTYSEQEEVIFREFWFLHPCSQEHYLAKMGKSQVNEAVKEMIRSWKVKYIGVTTEQLPQVAQLIQKPHTLKELYQTTLVIFVLTDTPIANPIQTDITSFTIHYTAVQSSNILWNVNVPTNRPFIEAVVFPNCVVCDDILASICLAWMRSHVDDPVKGIYVYDTSIGIEIALGYYDGLRKWGVLADGTALIGCPGGMHRYEDMPPEQVETFRQFALFVQQMVGKNLSINTSVTALKDSLWRANRGKVHSDLAHMSFFAYFELTSVRHIREKDGVAFSKEFIALGTKFIPQFETLEPQYREEKLRLLALHVEDLYENQKKILTMVAQSRLDQSVFFYISELYTHWLSESERNMLDCHPLIEEMNWTKKCEDWSTK